MHIYCVLLKEGWIGLEIHAGSTKLWNKVKTEISNSVDVFRYDKKLKMFKVTINELDKIDGACARLNIDMGASAEFARYIARYNIKIDLIEKASTNTP